MKRKAPATEIGIKPEPKKIKEEQTEHAEEEYEYEPVEKLLEQLGKYQLVVLLKEAVAKDPSLIKSVHNLADVDPVHRKIFVHGLGWDTTRVTLVSEFSKYGEIEDCKNVTDKVSGKSKGYGFILFKHRSGAKKSLVEPQKKIGNRVISCQLASAGPVLPEATPAAAPVLEYTQRKIFVSNVAAQLDPGKLTEFFAQFGEIEEGPLGLDKATGRPKGFCLFVYKTVDSAKKALEEPHKVFEGVTLYCYKAVDRPKPGQKGGFHQPNQQFHSPNQQFHQPNQQFHQPNQQFHQHNQQFHQHNQQFHPHNQQFHPHSSKKFNGGNYPSRGEEGPLPQQHHNLYNLHQHHMNLMLNGMLASS